MMNTYTRNTSEIIRNDFMRFSSGTPVSRARRRSGFDVDIPAVEAPFRGSLEDVRAEMADDDGSGSFASYKSPIF